MGGGAKEAKVKRGDEHKVLRWQGGDFIWRRLSSMGEGECDTYERGGGMWWWRGDAMIQQCDDLHLCIILHVFP